LVGQAHDREVAAMELLTTHLETGNPSVLRVQGEIDLATADQLGEALTQALSASQTVVVDMAGVTFIDGAGLRAIVQAAESMNGRAPLTLVNAPRVAWLLKVLGLSDIGSLDVQEGD